MNTLSTYSLLPLIAAFFVFFLGFFVWIKNPRSLLYMLFFLYSFTLTIWLFGTFQMFNADGGAGAIFWDRIIYIGVMFIPIFLYHFGLIYCDIVSQRKILRLGYLLSLIFLPISQTNFFVSGLFRYSWGVHTRAELFHNIFLVYFFFYFGLFFFNLYIHYKRSRDEKKKQVKYLLIGFAILDIVGPLAFLPAYGISVYPVIFLSAIPFVLLVAYAIVKYHALDLRVLSVEIFSTLTVILFISELFVSKSPIEMLLRSVGLFLAIFFAIMLVRGVKNEVKRREEIEGLNRKLQDATKQLKAQNQELQKLDQMKTEFISVASHQLRTPLTATKWALEFLSSGKKGKLTKDQKETVLDLTITNGKLVKLVNDLLNISRIDEGRLRIEPKPIDLACVVENTMHELMPIAEKMKLKVVEQYDKLPKIKLDENVVTKAISNFISNGIKYNLPGKKLFISVKKRDTDALITIKDEGIGIPKAEQKSIFQRFFRASNAATSHTEGSGLGLYIAKSAIELSGGSIWFESSEGKGTSFFITLPLAGSKAITGEKSLS